MEWILPKDGDERIIKKFFLFPICLNDKLRWMGTYRVKQRYEIGTGRGLFGTNWTSVEWID